MLNENESSEYTSSDSESDYDFLPEGEFYHNAPDLFLIPTLTTSHHIVHGDDINESTSSLFESSRNLGDSSVSEMSINLDSISQDDEEIVQSILHEFSEEGISKSVRECIDELIEAIDNSVSNKVKKRTRKRTVRKREWLTEKRKRAHQAGKAYINSKNKLIPAKKIKIRKDYKTSCKFKCSSTKISNELREEIFNGFYTLGREGKCIFISDNVTYTDIARQTTTGEDGNTKKSRRKASYSYFLTINDNRERICKDFFLGTLSISQKMVYNVHGNKSAQTGVPKPDQRGKYVNSKPKISLQQRELVLEHIKSFPTIDAHYCRAKTNKQYLESGLNITKMYELYKEQCEQQQQESVKESYYRFLFRTEFNIDFHIPKSDRCDRCEEYKVKKSENILITTAEEMVHNTHLSEKLAMRGVKESDKKDENILLLSYDLQNVVTLPKAEISSFFYKKKLNLYNLTAKTGTKKAYCYIWRELTSGRAGNDLASAFISILKKVIHDHPDAKDLVCSSK